MKLSRGDVVRYAAILLAALPAVSCGYRPRGFWPLPILFVSVPILLHHAMLFGSYARRGIPPRRRYLLLSVACVLALPLGGMLGRNLMELDFRFRRMALYEATVAKIERGEIPVGAEPVRIEVPVECKNDARVIWASRDQTRGVRAEFMWASVGFAGHWAYIYCRGASCEQDRGWRHYRRINERWLLGSDH